MSKQRLLFITTGGTIASVRTAQGLKPVLTSEELLAHLPELQQLCCPETLNLCSIDSTDLGPELIPAIFQQYDCVIVESFGVGGIPQRLMDAFAEELGDYDKTHKILILTTQVTYEGSDVGIYEVGKRVKNRFRFLEAHDMTIEAVVTKVMWLLAQNCENFDQLQQRFYRQINFDTFYH